MDLVCRRAAEEVYSLRYQGMDEGAEEGEGEGGARRRALSAVKCDLRVGFKLEIVYLG
jgi:hypothetical protein